MSQGVPDLSSDIRIDLWEYLFGTQRNMRAVAFIYHLTSASKQPDHLLGLQKDGGEEGILETHS